MTLALALLASLAAQETEPPRPDATQEYPESPLTAEVPSLDLGWSEPYLELGMATFSNDYHVDPTPFFTAGLRVPVTWFSPSGDAEGDHLALFAQVSLGRIERTLEPRLPDAEGLLFLAGAGMDYTLHRDESLMVAVQAGLQFGSHGGVTDLDDGFGVTAGLTGGLSLTESLRLVAHPQLIFGRGGDRIMLLNVGLSFSF